jgi:8-oxo-dGTP pyrophosphatase MutT (NUDIX family)
MISVKGHKLHISLDIAIPLPYKYRGGGVAVFRINKGQPEVLLGLRANNPGKGKWSFPGGGAEGAEKLTSAGIREFKEETGVQLYSRYITRMGILQIKKLLFEWNTVIIESTQNINLSQKSDLKWGEFISLKWVPISELDNYKLHRWVRDAVNFYLSGKMKIHNPKKPINPQLSSIPKDEKTNSKSGVNCLFDIAEMVLTKIDLDGIKYFQSAYQSSKSTAQEALYGV